MALLTRAAFLRRVTLAAAAPLASPAAARADEDDRAVLNFALLLEDLQVTLYREALELDLGFDLAGLLRTFADHENEHVERLRALGGGSAEPMRFAYGLETRDELLQLAPTVEDTVVGAYIGAIPAATTPSVRALLAGIVHTEAQQASTLRMLASETAAPAAFDEVLSRTVLLDPRPTLHRHMKASSRGVVALYSVTLLLSAALLFTVQPMVARLALPLFGSTPGVWTTALLFFQALLLVGYAYAHASTRRLGVRRQAGLHLGVVLLPLLALPIALPAGYAPAPEASQALRLLGLLTATVALPFFVVASTAPLLQRWLAGTSHRRARDPYFLYRASNVGSIAGLLAYPLAVEPVLGLEAQGRAWGALYLLLVVLLGACAVVLWRSAPAVEGESTAEVDEGTEPPTLRRRLRWLVLSFVPSTFLLGVTAFLTTDIAPVPLLWVVPLSLYLLTFVIAFSPRRDRGSSAPPRWPCPCS